MINGMINCIIILLFGQCRHYVHVINYIMYSYNFRAIYVTVFDNICARPVFLVQCPSCVINKYESILRRIDQVPSNCVIGIHLIILIGLNRKTGILCCYYAITKIYILKVLLVISLFMKNLIHAFL